MNQNKEKSRKQRKIKKPGDNNILKETGSSSDFSLSVPKLERKIVPNKPKTRRKRSYLKLSFTCLLIILAILTFYALSSYKKNVISSDEQVEESRTQVQSGSNTDKSLSKSAENNIKENISSTFSSDALEKINKGMSAQIFWTPVLVFILFITSVFLVYKSPESRGNVLINGIVIISFGIFTLLMLSKFDEVTAWLLPQVQSDPLRKQITFISNAISIIQIAIGVNIVSTALTTKSAKIEELNTASELKMLREEIESLRLNFLSK